MKISLFILIVVIIATSPFLYAAVESPHGDLRLDCNQCHVTTGWNQLLPVLKFDHNQTKYPLVGRHIQVQCIACHTSLKFAEAGTTCIDCHADIHRGQFTNECSACHTSDAWSMTDKMRERHAATRFPLVGVHAKLDCQACHANGQYTNVAIDCEGCHLDQFRATESPSHTTAAFSSNCAECHSIDNAEWKGARFEHPNTFPLIGGHALNDCNACHAAGFVATSSQCYVCHAADYEGTTNPNHVAGNFSQECATCHNTTEWQPATFDHNLSQFPLTGRHVDLSCAQCHVGGQFTGTTSDCYECHRVAFENTTNPDHETSGFPQQCAVCHTTNGWQPAAFNHNLTEFPLTGRHVSVNCLECHVGGDYANTPTDCWACHEAEFRSSTNPDHEAAQFPQTCATCHTTNGWQPATFDHNLSDFPLTGRHVTVNCLECHVGGNYTNTPTDCWSCHQADYNEAEDHSQDQYPHDCAMCHSPNNWQSTFNHSNTDFPLTGRHIQTNCNECHANGVFQGTPTDCWSCHQADYNDAEEHLSNNYPHDCAQCHNTNDWDAGGFNHSNTDFPLTGRHITTTCTQCHIDGQFNGTPTDCWACHEAQFRGSTNPDHEASQFPQTCATCHTTNGWQPATFDHNLSDFPLTGRHVTVNCLECHVGGNYTNTPTDCWSCHQADYNEAEDHSQDQYPHDCAMCHSPNNWQSTFNHNSTDFPLTGRHIQTNCNECHANGVFQGTPTDCWSCHQEDYNDAEDHLSDNYSHDCTQCHNTNDWDEGGFNHNKAGSPRKNN